MPLLYEEKEFIHQEEIMYTVFILDLRKRNRNRFDTCSPPPSQSLGKRCTIAQFLKEAAAGTFILPTTFFADLSSSKNHIGWLELCPSTHVFGLW